MNILIRIVAVAMLIVCTASNAADFEVSIGKTNHTQDGAYSVGISEDFSDSWRARVGLANLGTPSLNMNVSPGDFADDQQAGWGQAPCHWLTPRAMTEIYGTLDPVIYRGSYDYRMEFGMALYHSQWQQDICVNYYNEGPHAYGNPINITPIIGLVIGNKRVDYAITYQDITGRGDWEGNTPNSERYTFSIRWKF